MQLQTDRSLAAPECGGSLLTTRLGRLDGPSRRLFLKTVHVLNAVRHFYTTQFLFDTLPDAVRQCMCGQ